MFFEGKASKIAVANAFAIAIAIAVDVVNRGSTYNGTTYSVR